MAGIYWLASYPKSGNTWFRLFMANLLNDGQEPIDINRVGEYNSTSIASSRDWIDHVLGFDSADLQEQEIEDVRPVVYDWELKNDRIGYHKIHDAVTLTRTGRPIISKEATLGCLYIIRNPLDVAISGANHNNTTIDQSISNMARLRFSIAKSRGGQTNQVSQRLLSWSNHVRSWTERPVGKLLVIRYEDMLHNGLETFIQASKFLELPFESERVAKAIAHSSFTEVAKQEEEKGFVETPEKTQRFFRSGKSNDWRERLSKDQVQRVISDHQEIMRRYGYLDAHGEPVIFE